MSAIYDNWEKLVDAVLKNEQLWQLFHSDSISISSDSSGFSFCNLTSSLDDTPFAFPKQDGNSLPRIFTVEPIKNVASKPARKRDLKIEVPNIRLEDVSCSSECRQRVSPRTASARVSLRTESARVSPGTASPRMESARVSPRTESPRGGWIHSKSETKQQSYPLPLPPGAMSKSASVSPTIAAAKSPSASSRSPEELRVLRALGKRGS